MAVDVREIVAAFVKRIVVLVNNYVKHSTPATSVVVQWVRNNSDLNYYWHNRPISKAQMQTLVIHLCTSIITFSALPQCPDAGAMLDLIYDDPLLVEWCEHQGIIEGEYWPLTVSG